MAFDQEPTKTPIAIRDIFVELFDGQVQGQPLQKADFTIKIALDDGSLIVRSGDLVPHITAAQRQGLMDFMDDLRIQAEAEILGGTG